MAWFAAIRRRRAIKRLIRKLPRLLKKDYGRSAPYTPLQVQATMGRYGLRDRDLLYALVLSCDPLVLGGFQLDDDDPCDFEAVRMEIADCVFDGDRDFDVGDVELASADYGGDADGFGDGGAGGGEGSTFGDGGGFGG